MSANDLEGHEEDYEDMSVESEDAEGEEEEANDGVGEAVPLPTIQLSFDNSRGGAWDDRELVNAYDIAMEEFHVHHPGPGSWLDKATAAIAKGRPLPGATDHGTAWYTASYDDPVAQTPNAGPSTEPPPAKRPRKERRAPQHSAPGPVLSRSNPDSSQTVVTDRPATSRRRPSPSYAPRSPITQTRPPDWSRSNGLANGHAEPSGGEYDDVDGFGYGQSEGVNGGVRTSAVAPEPRSGSSSMIGVQATVGISADDALVYAMTAQYWAGYWMGVSQSKSSSSISPQAAQMADPVLTAPGVPAGGSSNVFVTRQQFYRPDRSDGAGLRR